MLNQITIMGRLTKDPELRRTPNGNAVSTFTIACDRDVKDKNGEKACDFIECVCWEGVAEFACKHLSKGKQVVVVGRLQLRKWQDKDGINRTTAEIITRSIYFADSKPQEGSYSPYAASVGKFAEITEEDGDLPF